MEVMQMNGIHVDVRLDAKGIACPLPIVRTKKKIEEMNTGQVLEVEATDQGSKADIKAWAEKTGHQYLGFTEEAGVLKHYVRKGLSNRVEGDTYPHTITNEELVQLLEKEDRITLIDVREEEEYKQGHIPEARSIPLGEIEAWMQEFDHEEPLYVICRTGRRSEMAAQMLAEKGINKVYNVMPGMSEWTGIKTKAMGDEDKWV